MSTDVSGIVTQVLVHDNQKVAKGDVLFKLDPLQFQLALDRAEAQVGNTRNDLVALQTSYRNMQAQVEQAQKDVDFNTVNFQRQEQLIANNFTPKATYDAARNTLAELAAKACLAEAAACRALPPTSTATPMRRSKIIPNTRMPLPRATKRRASLRTRVVHAPFAGIVTNVPSLQPGQYLAAAATAFNIVSTDHVWVQASPKETELTYVKPGQKVDGRGRHLSGPAMDRHRRQHQPGFRVELLAAAGREYQRQLGQGRAAHSDARQRHQCARQAPIARRHERRAERRYRT